MSNLGNVNAGQKAKQIANIFLQDNFDKKEEEPEKKLSEIEIPETIFSLTQLVGDYEIQPGVVARLSIKNDSLNLLQTWNKSTNNILKVNGNTFQISGNENLSFSFSNLKDGFTQTLKVLQDGRETIAARKKEVDTSGISLNDYIGSFFSKELDVSYIFEIENKVLKVSIEDKKRIMDCTISEIDLFTMEFGLVRFQRTDGQVSGFELDSGRVKNLKFEKK